MPRVVVLFLLCSTIALSGCSCGPRHDLPLKPGMPMDEVESILAENGYIGVPGQWHSYSCGREYSGAIAVYGSRKRSRHIVVVDYRDGFRQEEADRADEPPVGGPLLLHRFAYGMSKEPYASTPVQELRELLNAQETAEDGD